jgi:hypothetical protein
MDVDSLGRIAVARQLKYGLRPFRRSTAVPVAIGLGVLRLPICDFTDNPFRHV